VRVLKVTEIITANATSAYVDTFIEVNLFKFHNKGRTAVLVLVKSLRR
jgi:hypothetical protein